MTDFDTLTAEAPALDFGAFDTPREKEVPAAAPSPADVIPAPKNEMDDSMLSEEEKRMLNEFVEKILVHEADYSSGERVQEVEIYLNFIGKFELPVKEPTAEEIAEHEKLKARRAKKAEYNRRYMEKRRKRIAGEEQKSKEVTVNG